MNSDLTPAENVNATNNPQTAQNAPVGASDSTQFQQSAGADVLSKNQTLQVVTTGSPNPLPAPKATNNFGWLIGLVILLAVIAAFIAYRLPSKEKQPPKQPIEEDKKIIVALQSKPSPKPKGKKKQPRSKRNK